MIDDDSAFRRLIVQTLVDHGHQVEEYGTATEFLERCRPEARGCALIDLDMPHIDGAALQARMIRLGMRLPVIFVTATADVPTTASVMRQGAIDLIQKPADIARLLARVEEALALDARQSQALAAQLAHRQLLAQLTPREREVMDLAIQGMANKQIAMSLGISERTVEIHRSRFMSKMQVNSLAELVSRHVSSQVDPRN